MQSRRTNRNKSSLIKSLKPKFSSSFKCIVPIHLICKYDEEDDFKSKVMLIAESQSVQRNGLILISSNIKYYLINGLYMRDTDLF